MNTAPAARDLAQHGLAVFPLARPISGGCSCGKPACPSPGKHPLRTGWQAESATDPSVVGALWQRDPSANLGVDCEKSGVVVLDDDPRHGGDRTLAQLEGELGPLPATWTGLTSPDNRGVFGQHRYFRAPVEPIGSSTGKVGAGIDVKAVGGLVVGPGSLHASGHHYEWAPGCSPDEVEIAELPPAWAKRLREAGRAKAHSSNTAQGPVRVPEGGRNNHLASVGGALKARGFAGDDLLDMLLRANTLHCTPPLPESEVQQIAASLERYETGAVGIEPDPEAPVNPADLERDLEEARRQLADRDTIIETQRRQLHKALTELDTLRRNHDLERRVRQRYRDVADTAIGFAYVLPASASHGTKSDGGILYDCHSVRAPFDVSKSTMNNQANKLTEIGFFRRDREKKRDPESGSVRTQAIAYPAKACATVSEYLEFLLELPEPKPRVDPETGEILEPRRRGGNQRGKAPATVWQCAVDPTHPVIEVPAEEESPMDHFGSSDTDAPPYGAVPHMDHFGPSGDRTNWAHIRPKREPSAIVREGETCPRCSYTDWQRRSDGLWLCGTCGLPYPSAAPEIQRRVRERQEDTLLAATGGD